MLFSTHVSILPPPSFSSSSFQFPNFFPMAAPFSHLPQLLELGFSNNEQQRKQAETSLINMRKERGYLDALRQVMAGGEGGFSGHVRLAASIQFKAVIKKYWVGVGEEGENPVGDEEREGIKASLLDMALNSSDQVRKQLQDSIVEIGKHDFPQQWEGLLPAIVERAQQLENTVIVLKIANSITKKYRNQFKNEQILRELQIILSLLGQPLLELMKKLHHFVRGGGGGEGGRLEVGYGMKGLGVMVKIFYSLSFVDFPGVWGGVMGEWMEIFLFYLNFETKEESLLEHHQDEDKPGLLHSLQADICSSLGLYAEKYEQQFAPFMEGFAQATWQLLTKINHERRFDNLASQAIAFLNIASRGVSHKLFENPQAMRGICQQIIVPNMFFTPSDEDDFRHNPNDYIRRDIEGSDLETRRRSSFLFVKGLRRHFEALITQILAEDVTERLKRYQANPSENWREKNVCTYLISALTVTTAVTGGLATEINTLVPLLDYFQTHILSDLEGCENVVLQADALKFATTFRLHVPPPFFPTLLQLFTKFLASPSPVVHTYAAIAIEKFLTMRGAGGEGGRKGYRLGVEVYRPLVLQMLQKLFDILKQKQGRGEEDHRCNENDYVMKCIMRILAFEKQEIAPYSNVVFAELGGVLGEVAKNPQNPMFSHYLFESLGVVVKSVVKGGGGGECEERLLPGFEVVLGKDVVEYAPYVFQIMALMLEQGGKHISPRYINLFPQLLNPILWERTGNIPGLVRLLTSYMEKRGGEGDGNNGNSPFLPYLERIFAIFQKLVMSRMYDHQGLLLLRGVVKGLGWGEVEGYLGRVWNLLFVRLTKSPTTKFKRSFSLFLALFFAFHSPDNIISSIDSISPENPALFGMILGNVVLKNVGGVEGGVERKGCAVGLVRVLTESERMSEKYFELWAPTLATTLTLILGEEEEEDEEDDWDNEEGGEEELGGGYQTSFSTLNYGRKEGVDPFPGVKGEGEGVLVEGLVRLSGRYPGKITSVISSQLPPTLQKALQSLFTQLNAPPLS